VGEPRGRGMQAGERVVRAQVVNAHGALSERATTLLVAVRLLVT
jgi:hypothetical protein